MSAEEMKHTPGPWYVFRTFFGDDEVVGVTSRAEEHIDSDGDGADICSLENKGYFGTEQFEANARLIASAPALAARVSRLEQALTLLLQHVDCEPLCEQEHHDMAVRIARTALQEADRAHPQPMNDKTKES